VCHAFVSVKVSGVLEFVRTVKIQGFGTFRDVNHEGVDTILVTVAD
jgi:hypothetical protein